MTSLDANMTQQSPKVNASRQFEAKTLKSKDHNISEAINQIKPKFKDKTGTTNCTA